LPVPGGPNTSAKSFDKIPAFIASFCFSKGFCPFGAAKIQTAGYKMHIGGRWGKKVARGIKLNKIFETKEEVLSAIEKTILFFKENGLPGERFSDTINRVGFTETEKAILSDDILKRKDEILSK